jgi:hypothetical protein
MPHPWCPTLSKEHGDDAGDHDHCGGDVRPQLPQDEKREEGGDAPTERPAGGHREDGERDKVEGEPCPGQEPDIGDPEQLLDEPVRPDLGGRVVERAEPHGVVFHEVHDAVAAVRIDSPVQRNEQRPVRSDDLRIGLDAGCSKHAPHRSDRGTRHQDPPVLEPASQLHPREPQEQQDRGRLQHEDVFASGDGPQREQGECHDERHREDGRHRAPDECCGVARDSVGRLVPCREVFDYRH